MTQGGGDKDDEDGEDDGDDDNGMDDGSMLGGDERIGEDDGRVGQEY